DDRLEYVVERMLAADADEDLVRGILKAVVALERCAHGFDDFRAALGVGVLRLAGLQVLNGGLLDEIRRVEVRFPCAKGEDGNALGLEGLGLRRQGEGDRGSHLGNASGDLHGAYLS